MNKNKAKIYVEALEVYKEIRKTIQVKHKLDIVYSNETTIDDVICTDILICIIKFIGEIPEQLADEFLTIAHKGLKDLFYDIANVIEKVQQPDSPDIDVQIYWKDEILAAKAFVYDKSTAFITILVDSKDIYIKYMEKIYLPPKIISSEDLDITVLRFDTDIFKSTHHFDSHISDNAKKEGKMEFSDDKIVSYNNYDGLEFKRLIGCLIEGKPLVPEIETEKCTFKDFLGSIYIRDALKVTKVNVDGRYKVGDIITPDGKVKRKE